MPQRAPDYQPGQSIPGTVYRVHRVLGAGGMGTVYDVEDTSVGKRYVLKTLHGDLADRSDLAARLAREARALAKLQHPNIVEVYTSGTTQDGLRLPYYVMERLQGQSLRTVLERKGRLTEGQACDIGIDLLDALDHAHEFGIIHRDVKPDNIFITRGRDGRSLAKLLDFGIIKLATGVGTNTMHTGGRFIGTFRYAAPEQILGREVTPRSDLYAAGLVLYEMIAGRGPFDNLEGEMQIGKAHIDAPPPPLSRFVPVSPDLENLVMSALQKVPELRPRDSFTFASSLREIKKRLVGGPVSSRSNTQASTVEQVVEQPMSAARPAMAFGTQTTQHAEPLSSAATAQATRIDSPAGKVAPTAAAGVVSSRGQTLSLGVVQVPPPNPPEATYAAAPLPMTSAPAAPEPLHAAGIDRNADTRASPQEPLRQRPNYDTAPIPLTSPSRSPDPVAPYAMQPETFNPHTTDAPRLGGGGKALLAIAGAFVFVLIAGLGVVLLLKHRASATSAANTATATATALLPTIASAPLVESSPADTTTTTIAATAASSASSTVTTSTAVASSERHHSHATAAASTAPVAAITPQATATTVTPPATTTSTPAHHRPGSGL